MGKQKRGGVKALEKRFRRRARGRVRTRGKAEPQWV